MKKILALLFLLLTAFVGMGQNLVPNPSFEDTLYCPTQVSQVGSVVNWFPVSQTPDYFNSCATNSFLSVPDNMMGYQYAVSGNGYIGMFCYYNAPPNYREYIGTQLTNLLIIGQKYFVSFNLCLAGRNYNLKACNKFGCKLSTAPFIANSLVPVNSAFFYSDSIITDTTNWVLIKGSFIADSAYSFIAFGNFFDDSHTDTMSLNFNGNYNSYYFIDDVCLSTDSLTCYTPTGIESAISNPQSVITISPNPFTDELIITNKNNEEGEIILYDVAGRIVARTSLPSGEDRWGLQLPKGMYLYEVRSGSGIIKQGKVVKQ